VFKSATLWEFSSNFKTSRWIIDSMNIFKYDIFTDLHFKEDDFGTRFPNESDSTAFIRSTGSSVDFPNYCATLCYRNRHEGADWRLPLHIVILPFISTLLINMRNNPRQKAILSRGEINNLKVLFFETPSSGNEYGSLTEFLRGMSSWSPKKKCII